MHFCFEKTLEIHRTIENGKQQEKKWKSNYIFLR